MNFYEDLAWGINVNLRLSPEKTSITLQYTFINQSNSNEFYFSLLPSFQCVPLGAINNDWISIDAKLWENDKLKGVLFSICDKIQGLRKTNECFIPIPWLPAGGGIPPKNVLKLDINWVEHGPIIDNKGESDQEWRIHYCLPMRRLFLPLELKGDSPDIYLVQSPEDIKWQISYPTGIHVKNVYFESFKPDYDVKPYVNSPSGTSNPLVEFRVEPNSKKINGRSFSDHIFTLVSQLSVPIDISLDVLNRAEQKVMDHTTKVCVAAIDLRGSSKMADRQKDLPDPTLFTSNFHKRTMVEFPHSSHRAEPLFLLMKKVIGDMLILIAPVERTNDVFQAVIAFVQSLEDEGFLSRAGFHVDQATDTGRYLNSYFEFGTDFLGPGINYAVKVGDDKTNEGIRITESVLERLFDSTKNLFEFEAIDPISAKPNLKIYQTTPKPTASAVPISSDEYFSDRLINQILQKNSRICVGLDPDLNRFPKILMDKYGISKQPGQIINERYYENVSKCIIEFNKRAIDSVCKYAAAVKPQSAHYERYGYYGIKSLYETAIYAKQRGLIVILDAKRNDIDRTAKKYAIAYLGSDSGENCASIPFDAITVNSYLGFDGIKPFLEVCEENKKGIFVLVKTSNASSTDFQDLLLDSEKITLAQKVAQHVNEWGNNIIGQHRYSSIGAVVGATHPELVKTLREIMPSSIFLMPGYGAQGATAEDVVDSFDENGLGAIISSSSAINYAFPPEAHDFENYIGAKAKEMRDDINRVLSIG